MHVKHVHRETVREALAEARALLGPDALVLSTELVPAPGWRGWCGRRIVRLTAAAERPQPAPDPDDVSVDRSDVSEKRPDLAPAPPALPALTRRQQSVAAKLVATGVDRGLASAVAARLTDHECRFATDETLRRAVGVELETLAADDAVPARYEVFIGPPGVGKTTTIAKIAAQARAAHGRTTSLVAADGFRAGAIEQLRSYAEIVRSPFRVARTADELDAALGASRHQTLIDTAGTSGAGRNLPELFDVLRKRRRVRSHLVLAGDTSPAATRRILERFAPLGPARVVLTKLDECESIMPLLGVLRESGLRVSYLTAGQRVPEDLRRATPAVLAAALLGETTPEGLTCH